MPHEINGIWTAIQNWLKDHVPIPQTQWGFLPPASEAQIHQIRTETGYDPPEDLRQLLKINNGQAIKTPLHWLPNGMHLHATDKIIETWHYWMKLYTKFGEDEFSQETYFQNKIRNIIFHPKRLIIADSDGGVMMALDGIPGPAGIHGQILFDISECDFIVGAESLTAFLKKYLLLMEKGSIYYDTETYNQMMPTNPDSEILDLLIDMEL